MGISKAMVLRTVAGIALMQLLVEATATRILLSGEVAVTANQWYWVYHMAAAGLYSYVTREHELVCGDLRLLTASQYVVLSTGAWLPPPLLHPPAMGPTSRGSPPASTCIQTRALCIQAQYLLMASGGLLRTQPSSGYWYGDDGHHGQPT